jgi:hypothetical protein
MDMGEVDGADELVRSRTELENSDEICAKLVGMFIACRDYDDMKVLLVVHKTTLMWTLWTDISNGEGDGVGEE